MSRIDTLIDEFQNEGCDKCWIIQQLEDIDNKQTIDFLVKVIRDENEEDYVRVETLKAFRFKNFISKEHKKHVALSILNVIINTDEDTVKNYCALALANFFEFPNVFKTLEKIVLDFNEDEDFRYNALESLEDNSENSEVMELFKKLSTFDDYIGEEIRDRF